ncbi:hypothetical protein [uncultured Lacinutrix sp.]|uniref:DUF6891 domain-containing protein n=1 Tax=uncultured Lacinutrix sp. TaxID=574032 RepID=UPI002626E00A|nr:hypothetical protein [uncultured Lacinutrix sp.]
MKQKVKTEAIEHLERDILFGFESKDDLFESISELFYNEDDFDNDWFKTEIEKRFSSHLKSSENWKKPTDFERLVKVFDQLNKEKIVSLHKAGHTRQDSEEDCREIIEELEAIGIKAKGYCYYHSQDLERAIEDNGMLFIGYDSNEQNDGIAFEIANRIIELLKENGFKTEWNGSLDTRIEIKSIVWKKAYDNTDYNYSRVFSIIEKYHTPTKKVEKKKPFWKFW